MYFFILELSHSCQNQKEQELVNKNLNKISNQKLICPTKFAQKLRILYPSGSFRCLRLSLSLQNMSSCAKTYGILSEKSLKNMPCHSLSYPKVSVMVQPGNLSISTNRRPVPRSRVGQIRPITEEHFHDFAKLLEASKRPTYAAIWHRRSISRYSQA